MASSGFSWKSPWTALAHDMLSIPIAWFCAYWVRFNLSTIPPDILQHAAHMLPWIMGAQACSFWFFGLYRGVWRYASLPDLVRIFKAVSIGCLLSLLLLFFLFRLNHMPRTVFPLYGTLLLLLLGGSRFFYRWLKDYRSSLGIAYQRVLIVGAGTAGESLCRDLLRDQTSYLPVAFVDNNSEDLGREIHGIQVKGNYVKIPDIVQSMSIDLILLAIPNANAKEIRHIHTLCQSTGKPVHTLPSIDDLFEGRVSVKNLRKISLSDLLGRDPVNLDKKAIQESLTNKVVLISGGAGSIGSELCRQVIKFLPKELIIIDNNEYHLFLLEQEFNTLNKKISVHRVLVDINDEKALEYTFKQFNPHVVFHAAAYKHVPMLQNQVRAAVRNNILGTIKIAKIAIATKVEKFILVSTDKAVNPTSIMGLTKRVAELVCQYHNQHQTQFITVRFGNVLGSRGSVIETFQQQLEKGGPLTVTHPKMTRFFMTTKEACQLILQAAVLGHGGEVFVLDMGEPVNIAEMAEQMIKLAGKKPYEDIPIEYIGLRDGEKLYEELFHHQEPLLPTLHTKILKAKHREIDENYFLLKLLALETACASAQEEKMINLLLALVPEYQIDQKPEIKHLACQPQLEMA